MTPRNRVGAIVFLCIGLGLLAAGIISYTYREPGDWWNYSFWARRWILFTGVILVGVIARIVFLRDKAREPKQDKRDTIRKI